jgi:hypothetical protein
VISLSVAGPQLGGGGTLGKSSPRWVCESVGGYRTTMVTRSGSLNRRSKQIQ